MIFAGELPREKPRFAFSRDCSTEVFDMLYTFAEMFSYTFIVRAVVVGLLVSLCAALLGVGLVLKRYSMIGDGLSHVGFGALAAATAMNAAPLAVAIPVVVLAAFFLLRLSESGKIKGDAAIALISTGSLAAGIILISLTSGINTDVCNYLFGSILAMSREDVVLSVFLAVVVLALFVLFYNKIFAITFDESFARASGVRTGLYNMLIALLTAVTIVLGMRMMGAMLISGLIIFPALTSMRLCKRFKSVTICAVFVSVICFLAGVAASYLYATPTGASVVIVNIAAFLLFWAMNLMRGKLHMKKIFVLLVFALALQAGCGSASGSEGGESIVEIKEKMFVAQTNDIYYNPEEYLGKIIKYEGIFQSYELPETGENYCIVIRYGPGCCGIDADVGFEVSWDSGYPCNNDWVEVTGVLEEYEESGYKYLRVSLSEMNVLATRGSEVVVQ
jgi:zinc transport system permease protein